MPETGQRVVRPVSISYLVTRPMPILKRTESVFGLFQSEPSPIPLRSPKLTSQSGLSIEQPICSTADCQVSSISDNDQQPRSALKLPVSQQHQALTCPTYTAPTNPPPPPPTIFSENTATNPLPYATGGIDISLSTRYFSPYHALSPQPTNC